MVGHAVIVIPTQRREGEINLGYTVIQGRSVLPRETCLSKARAGEVAQG